MYNAKEGKPSAELAATHFSDPRILLNQGIGTPHCQGTGKRIGGDGADYAPYLEARPLKAPLPPTGKMVHTSCQRSWSWWVGLNRLWPDLLQEWTGPSPFKRTLEHPHMIYASSFALTQLFSILPGGSAGKESACNVGDLGLEDPLERGTLPTPEFWHGEFPGQRTLAGYSPRGRRVRLSNFH